MRASPLGLRFFVVSTVLATLTIPVSSQTPVPIHSFELNGDLVDSQGGTAVMTPNGGTLGSSSYQFGPNQGLTLTGAQLANSGQYSIEMRVRLETIHATRTVPVNGLWQAWPWIKLIDFKDLTQDEGLYSFDHDQSPFGGAPTGGAILQFYPIGGTSDAFFPGQFVHVVLTRDDSTGLVTAYAKGVGEFSFSDWGGVAEFDPITKLMHFLIDDFDMGPNNSQDESGSGSIDFIRVYDTVLTSAEVSDLNDQANIDSPPVAHAGSDFSVNEGQVAVVLDGTASNDPDGDALSYSWAQLPSPTVVIADPTAAQTTFDAPFVTSNATLTFELTVTANGVASTDTIDITIVNVNSPPVADAGEDQSVAEGSPVTLNGGDSFDVDMDVLSYSWMQTSGQAVTLIGANTANPTFTAPYGASGGAPGVVDTLTFELTVDDGSGGTVDTVTVEVTNVNNVPVASAGSDQTVDEDTFVMLSGHASSDPDGDTLTFWWTQTGGTAVVLSDPSNPSPTFTAPFVNPGGGDFIFTLTVDDGYGGIVSDTVVVHVMNANDPPLITAARPSSDCLWPPNHKLESIEILGVSDPDNNATITIDAVYQDEPTLGTGSGDTAIDAIISGDGTVLLRAERSGNGDGRVYHIHFTAADPEGSASGVVTVCVPHSKKSIAIDGGGVFDSTL